MKKNTSDLKYAKRKIWRYQQKLKLLEILKKENRDLTTGEIFLMTGGRPHGTIHGLMRELCKEGLILSAKKKCYTYTCRGARIPRDAIHWCLAPHANLVPLQEALRELMRRRYDD